MSAIIHRAAEGICICQTVPTFPFVEFSLWNRRMEEITGYTMEEINRLGWYQSLFKSPEIREAAMKRMEGVSGGNDMIGEEWVVTTKDGLEKTLLISSGVLTHKDGSVHMLGLMHDITHRKNLEERLRAQASIDYLMEIPNRRAIIEALDKEVSRLSRYGGCASVMMLDLDYFKKVNDEHGHTTGDHVLKGLSQIALAQLRPYDILGRFGGEEFLVILPETCREDARIVGERLRRAISGAVFNFEGAEVRVTVSIGIAEYRKTDNSDSLIKRADDKLYAAKRNGRDQVIV